MLFCPPTLCGGTVPGAMEAKKLGIFTNECELFKLENAVCDLQFSPKETAI